MMVQRSKKHNPLSALHDNTDLGGRVKVRRPLWKKLLLAAAGVLLAPMVLEILLRLWYAHPLSSIAFMDQSRTFTRYYVMPDPKAGYVMRPYFHGRMTNPWGDFDVEFDINEYGFRDRHDPTSRPEGKILAVGDSLTFGHGIRDRETYPEQLEAVLKKADFPQTEVINAGVPGYSLNQELITLDRAMPLYHPSLVILGWMPRMYIRDLAPLNEYYQGFLIMPEREKDVYNVRGYPFLTPFATPIFRRLDILGQAHSLAYLFVRMKIYGYSMDTYRAIAKDHVFDPLKPSMLGSAVALIEQAKDKSWEGGANFLLLAFCYDEAESRLVRDLCEPRGILVFPIELKKYLETHPAESGRVFFRHDPHPTAMSYSLVCSELANYLERRPRLVFSGRPELSEPAEPPTNSTP